MALNNQSAEMAEMGEDFVAVPDLDSTHDANEVVEVPVK